MISLIPTPWKVGAAFAFAVAAFSAGVVVGTRHEQSARADEVARMAQSAIRTQKAQSAVTEKVVTQYVDRVKIVHAQGETIIKEIPKYVPNDSCSLPAGFRLLHDSAATGASLPDPAGIADASAVPATDIAGTIAVNYRACRENSEQLISLQSWVAQQAGLKE